MKKLLFATVALTAFTCVASAEEYVDPQHKIVYTYELGSEVAMVKAGRSYFRGGTEQESEYEEIVEPGSPDAIGDIIIQDMLVTDGHNYTVNSIGEYAFYLSPITKVVIPKTILSIGIDAFAFSDLVSVVSYIEDPFDTDAFRYLNTSNIILYVPNGCGIKYKTVKGWSNFDNIVEMDTTDIQFTVDNEQTFPQDLIFDLSGRRLSNMHRNVLYIQNGRKVMVK